MIYIYTDETSPLPIYSLNDGPETTAMIMMHHYSHYEASTLRSSPSYYGAIAFSPEFVD